MKWVYRPVFVVVLMSLPTAGWGLTLDEAACPQLGEFDALGNSAAALITLLWGDLYGTWPEWDVEYVDGTETGDGVNDSWQMALLAAVLCAEPWIEDPFVDLELVRQQYAANLANAETLAADLVNVAPVAPLAGQLMWDVGEGLLTEFPFPNPLLYVTIVDMPEPGDRLLDLVLWLRRVGDDIIVISGYGFDLFATALSIFSPWTAGMSGLNAGMQAQVDLIMVDRITKFAVVASNPGLFEDLADDYAGVMSPELEQSLRDFAALLPTISFTTPTFVVFGDGSPDEPLAGASDWNGDGLTNEDVFGLVWAAGGTREDFVLGVTREGPAFDPQPADLKRYLGEDAQFTVGLTDPILPLSYQWDFEPAKADIPGATEDTLDVLSVTLANAGTYFCTVTDMLGSYFSPAASLEVAAHLEIVEHPEGGDVEWLGTHTFEVATTGGFQPLMFQWFKDDRPILIATEASFTTSMLTPADSGAYYVEISDNHADVQVSRAATIIVDDGMPVAAGVATLALLAGALALGAAAALPSKG